MTTAEQLPSWNLLKDLRDNWPVLSGAALAFITIGILWAKVETNTEKIRAVTIEQSRLADIANATRTDVAVIRTILEERTKNP